MYISVHKRTRQGTPRTQHTAEKFDTPCLKPSGTLRLPIFIIAGLPLRPPHLSRPVLPPPSCQPHLPYSIHAQPTYPDASFRNHATGKKRERCRCGFCPCVSLKLSCAATIPVFATDLPCIRIRQNPRPCPRIGRYIAQF